MRMSNNNLIASSNGKLGVDFPETEKQVEIPVQQAPVVENVVSQPEPVVPQDDIVLPFGSPAFATGGDEDAPVEVEDIPQMPLYDSDNYNNLINAVGSEQNVSK